MTFIPKPNKDKSNPLNYRPICLLEIILKLFEKIIAQRILYFLEFNNLLTTEKQLNGFRAQRSTTTQHPIALAQMVIDSNSKTGKTTLITTRDVEKALNI